MPIFPRLYAGLSEWTMTALKHLPRLTGEAGRWKAPEEIGWKAKVMI
jgi:hypothetical protein